MTDVNVNLASTAAFQMIQRTNLFSGSHSEESLLHGVELPLRTVRRRTPWQTRFNACQPPPDV